MYTQHAKNRYGLGFLGADLSISTADFSDFADAVYDYGLFS